MKVYKARNIIYVSRFVMCHYGSARLSGLDVNQSVKGAPKKLERLMLVR